MATADEYFTATCCAGGLSHLLKPLLRRADAQLVAARNIAFLRHRTARAARNRAREYFFLLPFPGSLSDARLYERRRRHSWSGVLSGDRGLTGSDEVT